MATEAADSVLSLLVPDGDRFALWDRFGGGTLSDGRVCRPGPGTLSLVTTDGTWSIASSRAAFDATGNSPGDLAMVPDVRPSLARVNEPNVSLRLAVSTTNGGLVLVGPTAAGDPGSALDSLVSVDASSSDLYLRDIGNLALFASLDDVSTLGLQMDVDRGAYLFGQRDSLGPRFYLLGWLPDDGTELIDWVVVPSGEVGTVDNLQVKARRRWTITTLQSVASPVVNTVYTGAASLVADIGFTLASLVANDKIELRFRRVDADNYWRVRLQTNAGGTAASLLLDEVVATSSTTRATFSNVLTGAGTVYAQVRGIVGDTITLNYRLSQYGGFENGTVYSPASTLDVGTGLQVVRTGTSGTAANLMAWSTGPY